MNDGIGIPVQRKQYQADVNRVARGLAESTSKRQILVDDQRHLFDLIDP